MGQYLIMWGKRKMVGQEVVLFCVEIPLWH